MTFKSYEINILWRVLLLFATLSAASFFLLKGLYVYEIIFFPVIILQLYNLFSFHKKTQDEVDQFVEAIHYKDFSRNFNVSNAPVELKSFLKRSSLASSVNSKLVAHIKRISMGNV